MSASVSPARRPMNPTFEGVAFALLATVVWSFNFIVGRGFADTIPPCTLALGRWIVAFCAVFPFALPSLLREWRHFIRNWRYYIVISLIGIAFFNTAIYQAAHSVPALNLSLIATTSPIFTIVFSRIFFGEAITFARLAGIFLALSGILLLLTKGDFGVLASLSFQGGDLLMLAAAVSFSAYTLLVRKKPAGCGQAAYFTVTFGLGALFLVPLAVWEISRGVHIDFSPQVVGAFLYMGVGASLFSFWCWSRSINAFGPSKAAVVYYSLPLFCGIEAVLFLGESVLWVHYVGGALILGGMILATRERRVGL